MLGCCECLLYPTICVHYIYIYIYVIKTCVKCGLVFDKHRQLFPILD